MTNNQQNTPPNNGRHEAAKNSPFRGMGGFRNSNLELYRIIVMLLIVAHHYVVNSGLYDVLAQAPFTTTSVAMLLFGAWGKTGINCFVMITGWFMCRSRFSWKKVLKLYTQITLYAVVIYAIFCITGHEQFQPLKAILKFFPIKSIADGFVSCFLIFYLLIPFLNILIDNMDKRAHATLLIVLLTIFTLLPTIPAFNIRFNYVEWFCTLYFTAAYIRNYGLGKISHHTWGWLTLALILTASVSIVALTYIYKAGYVHSHLPYLFVADSNKILAFAIGVASFMYFKDLNIPHSKLINTLGAATFGVLLIHANSDTMRQWLWRETVDCTGHFSDSLLFTFGYASTTVLLIFIICAGIDWLRAQLTPSIHLKVKLMDD